MRKFEIVEDWAKKYGVDTVALPKRATKFSAGYDFISPINIVIGAGCTEQIYTNIKVMMDENNALILTSRSSFGKKGIIMPNSIGLVDADYYNNPDNDGNLCFLLKNTTDKDFEIIAGDRIGQGFFINYLKTDDDVTEGKRSGGFGSTGKN